jgi:hypothetical protein
MKIQNPDGQLFSVHLIEGHPAAGGFPNLQTEKGETFIITDVQGWQIKEITREEEIALIEGGYSLRYQIYFDGAHRSNLIRGVYDMPSAPPSSPPSNNPQGFRHE